MWAGTVRRSQMVPHTALFQPVPSSVWRKVCANRMLMVQMPEKIHLSVLKQGMPEDGM